MYENIKQSDGIRGLLAPSAQCINMVDKSLQIFENKFYKICFKKSIKLKLFNIIKKDVDIQSWLQDEHCAKHLEYFIDKLILCKIHFSAKLLSANFRDKTKSRRKLQILQLLIIYFTFW